MPRHYIILSYILILWSASAFSQGSVLDSLPDERVTLTSSDSSRKERPKIFDKIFWGGNLGLAFGTITSVEASPFIGFRFTERFGAGLGYTYIYYRYNDDLYDYRASVSGGRIFARYLFLEQVFAYGEYEGLFYRDRLYPNSEILVESLLAGIGLRQEIGHNVYANLLILYNLNYEPGRSFYGSPIVIRPGISVGF